MEQDFKEYVFEVARDFNLSIKDRVDKLLEINAFMYTELGSDSTKLEREEAKKNSRVIFRAIKEVDPYVGEMFLQHQDNPREPRYDAKG